MTYAIYVKVLRFMWQPKRVWTLTQHMPM